MTNTLTLRNLTLLTLTLTMTLALASSLRVTLALYAALFNAGQIARLAADSACDAAMQADCADPCDLDTGVSVWTGSSPAAFVCSFVVWASSSPAAFVRSLAGCFLLGAVVGFLVTVLTRSAMAIDALAQNSPVVR